MFSVSFMNMPFTIIWRGFAWNFFFWCVGYYFGIPHKVNFISLSVSLEQKVTRNSIYLIFYKVSTNSSLKLKKNAYHILWNEVEDSVTFLLCVLFMLLTAAFVSEMQSSAYKGISFTFLWYYFVPLKVYRVLFTVGIGANINKIVQLIACILELIHIVSFVA